MKLAHLGPGLLLAATGIGVGDLVSSIITGAEFGMTLAWALTAGVAIKFAIAEGTARWQLATGTTVLEGWRDHLPRAAVLAFFAYFVVWSYMVSSALVAASSLVPAALVPAVPFAAWGVLHALGGLALVSLGRYEHILTVAKGFIGLMFAAVLVAALLIVFRTGADWTALGARTSFSAFYALSIIGGVGGTVTLLSYGYWMREAGWTGRDRIPAARSDLAVSFALALIFSLAMIFISSQVDWAGQILDEGPRVALLLADRIGAETGALGRLIFLAGFWGTAFSSVLGVWHGVPFLFDDGMHLWRRTPAPGGQRGRAYRAWTIYLTLASISALAIQRPVWLVFAYTVVGSLFFPFVTATLLYLNNSRHMPAGTRSGAAANTVLIAALLLYLYLALQELAL